MSKATIEKYKSQVEKLTEENEEVQLHLQIHSLYLNNSKRNTYHVEKQFNAL